MAVIQDQREKQVMNASILVDLKQTLDSLSNNLSANTKILKSLKKSLKDKDDDAEDKVWSSERTDKVPVEVHVSFVRVMDVDTKSQSFAAEIFLQAKWHEPLLAGETQKKLDEIDLTKLWNPQIKVLNIEGDLDEDLEWFRASERDSDQKNPIMFYRRRMRGKFKETLELKDFPVDVQELTIQVTSDRSEHEVLLLEDSSQLSSVNMEAFMDEQEFTIYKHVVIERKTASQEYTGTKHSQSKLNIMCHVARKPGYFMWNIVLIMFFLTSLTFVSFVIEPINPQYRLGVTLTLLLTAVTFKFIVSSSLPSLSYLTHLASKPQARLGVTLTLLLTSVAFKFVVGTSLPTISYLTYLDMYILAAMVFLMLQAVQNSVIAIFAFTGKVELTKIVDNITMIGMASVSVFYHVTYMIFLVVKTKKKKKHMEELDREYSRRGQLLETDSSKKKGKKSKVQPRLPPLGTSGSGDDSVEESVFPVYSRTTSMEEPSTKGTPSGRQAFSLPRSASQQRATTSNRTAFSRAHSIDMERENNAPPNRKRFLSDEGLIYIPEN